MALTPEQKSSRLFKKSMGAAETILARDFFEEPKLGNPNILPDQIWTQADSIPATAPTLSDGQTSGVVQYFDKKVTAQIAGSTLPGTTMRSFYHADLIDAIPFNYADGTYNYALYKTGGSTQIAFGEGDWLLDTAAGVLTFYGTVPSGVDAANPPEISFYKYVGTKGLSGGSGSGFNIKDPVIAASTTNYGNYSSAISGFTVIPTVDGVSSFNDDDRILIKDQTAELENGVFIVSGTTLVRAIFSEVSGSTVAIGDYVFVESGTTNIASSWVLNTTNAIDTADIDPGVDTQVWVLFSRSAAYTAGQGLELTGQEFQVTDALYNQITGNTSDITVLSTALSTEISTTDSEVTSLSTSISTTDSSAIVLSTALSTEISTTDSEVTSLSSALSGEISSTDSEVTSLSTAIDGVTGSTDSLSTALSSEISTRTSESSTYLTLTGGTMSGDIDMDGNQVIVNTAPVSDFDLANKAYVDAVAQGTQPHAPALLVSLTNITLSLSGQTIDGVIVSGGERVLIAGQTDETENGIYDVNSGGTWLRALDADGQPDNEIKTGDFVFVSSGATEASSGWVLGQTDATGTTIIPDVDTQVWFKMSAPGSYTTDGQGIELVGNEFSLELDGITLTKSASGLKLSDTISSAISTNTSDITVLSTALSSEISATDSDVTSLSTSISTTDSSAVVLSTALSSEISSTDSDVTSLSTAIDGVTGATDSLSTALSTEISATDSDVTSLSTAIDGVTGATDSLSTALSSEISATDSDVTSLSTSVSTTDSTAVVLSTALSSEISATDSDVTSLSTAIDGVTGATDSLSTALSSEISATDSDVTSLSTSISTTDSSAVVLSTALSSEISATDSDVTSLSTSISTTDSSAVVLSTALSSEISATDSDVTSLSTAIENVEGLTAENAGSGLTYIAASGVTGATLNVNVDDYTVKVVNDQLRTPETWMEFDIATTVSGGTSGATNIALDYDPVGYVSAYVNGVEYLVSATATSTVNRPFFFIDAPLMTIGSVLYFDASVATFDLIAGTDLVMIKYSFIDTV